MIKSTFALLLTLSLSLVNGKACTPYSAKACPKTYNSCCKYLCAEAQVPFALCNSKDETGQFASCSRCPSHLPTPKPTVTKITITTRKTTTSKPKPPTTTSCIPFSAPNNRCPSTPNKCCAYLCGEAQVPFNVCQPTDGSGQFAQCSKCPTTTVKATPTSTCTAFSAPAGKCPAKYNSCCAYLCAEAQVPFRVCQSTDGSGKFAKCTKCAITPTPTKTSTFNPATCTPRSAANGKCPTKYDPCCAYKCAEAQVPFDVCQPTDGSGQFAVCTKCPTK